VRAKPRGDKASPSRARWGRIKRAANGAPIGWEYGPVVFPAPLDTRSPESDRDRLAHLSATVHDIDGIAAHVASGEPRRGECLHRAARPGFKRPMSARDRATALSESLQLPPGWGAIDMFTRGDSSIEQAIARADHKLKRGPKLIRVRYPRDLAINSLASMPPLERLSYLRSMYASFNEGAPLA
jgi:hypothetical protein